MLLRDATWPGPMFAKETKLISKTYIFSLSPFQNYFYRNHPSHHVITFIVRPWAVGRETEALVMDMRLLGFIRRVLYIWTSSWKLNMWCKCVWWDPASPLTRGSSHLCIHHSSLFQREHCWFFKLNIFAIVAVAKTTYPINGKRWLQKTWR